MAIHLGGGAGGFACQSRNRSLGRRNRLPHRRAEVRRSALAICGMQADALCGRQSCLQAAFQAAVEQTTHAVRSYFSGFVSRKHRAAKPEKFVAYGAGGLKGRLQARLPATRKAKGDGRAEARRRLESATRSSNRFQVPN
jgi:hypothetical protein